MCCESDLRRSGTGRLEDGSVLDDLRRRRVLSLLWDRSRPIPIRTLAERVAARETDVRPSAVTDAKRRSVRLDLRHRCLPRLEAAGWIEREADAVALDGPPSSERVAEGLSLPSLHAPEDPTWEPLGVLLSRPRRLDLLSIVASRPDDRPLTALVDDLQTRDDRHPGWPSTDRELTVLLHHVDLPKVAAADLVTYDADARTIAGTPGLATFVERTGLNTD
jgi:hypothetical protein